MNNIKKECWIQKEQHKFFGKLLYEKTTYCDTSNFERPESSSFYTVPKIFQTKE